MVLVLTGLIPNLDDTKSSGNASLSSLLSKSSANMITARHDLNDEAVALLRTALSALVDASQVFPAIIKTDLHACILHIFSTILKTPACQATVVPQSLPIMKRFVTSLASLASADPDSATQLRATLLSFLKTLKWAQQREFPEALACEKNTIFATTILLSSSASALQHNDPLVKRFIEELFDCMGNRMTSKVAAGCCRSLLMLPKKGATETAVASQILPQVLSFLANPDETEGLAESRSLLAQALVQFLGTLQGAEQKGVAMKIVIPALLARAQKEEGTEGETAGRLLEIAGVDQGAFRSAVQGLSPEQRQFMEGVLKKGSVRQRQEVQSEAGEPTIALKMEF